MLCCLGSLTTVSGDPGPGDVFREFVWRGPFVNAGNWQRVTDPNASHAGAQEFLPNPVNVIQIDDLTMAIGAEVTIELWGGHAGTSNRRLRINGGDWIAIGEPPGIPGDAGLHPDPQCYEYFTYPSVTIPLDALRLGDNTFEFTSGGQTCFDFGWGQWGLWGAIFRVFYDAGKPHTSGRIVSPAGGSSFDDTLRIALAADPTVGADDAIARVDVMARYEDFDYEGNGIWREWHHVTRRGRLRHHVGSDLESPFEILWPTTWVPDQRDPVDLIARVLDRDGIYSMTEIVGGLVLDRPARSVRLYKPYDVPPRWATRVGRRQSAKVYVNHDLRLATQARMILATWSGGHADAIGVNGVDLVPRVGVVHDLSLDRVDVPVGLLRSGANEFFTFARTEHHGIEVLWPGIALKVAYSERLRDAPAETAVSDAGGLSLPAQVELMPAYPNPFNGSTHLSFELDREGVMELSVYDLGGQRITSLAEAYYGVGHHEVVWRARSADGRRLASGVYFVRLRVGKTQRWQRILLLK